MKILSGDLSGKDINFSCRCCNASFNLESKDDFYIKWMYKPINRYGYQDRNIKIPVYSVICPVCGYKEYIGEDPRDCGDDYNETLIRNVYANIIFNRDDWGNRYKIDIKVKE